MLDLAGHLEVRERGMHRRYILYLQLLGRPRKLSPMRLIGPCACRGVEPVYDLASVLRPATIGCRSAGSAGWW